MNSSFVVAVMLLWGWIVGMSMCLPSSRVYYPSLLTRPPKKTSHINFTLRLSTSIIQMDAQYCTSFYNSHTYAALRFNKIYLSGVRKKPKGVLKLSSIKRIFMPFSLAPALRIAILLLLFPIYGGSWWWLLMGWNILLIGRLYGKEMLLYNLYIGLEIVVN